MFGQQNTPFGSSGGFGHTNTVPAFGTSAPAPGGLFGTPSPAAFGAPAPSAFGAPPAPSGFGAPPSAPFGGGFGAPASGPFGAPAPSTGLFGQPAPAPAFGSAFGAPAPVGGLFGTPATGAFGQPAPAPAFGQTTAGGGLFGTSTASSSPFGSTTSTFGAPSPAPAFGSTFGATAPAPAFGAPTGGLFGQPAPAPVFGTGLFGQHAPAPTAFGGTAFGAPSPAPAGGLFGAPTGAFGAAPTTGPFGAPVGMPGQQEGTRAVPFQVTTKKDNNATINLHSVTAMPQYENKSFEELRFEDYSQGNKGTAAAPTMGPAPGGFSFGAAPAPTGGLFGAPAPAPFGAPAPSPFGAPAAFGAPATTFGSSTGLFGAKAPAPFGSVSSGGLFGAPAPAPFGAPAPSGGLFGAPAPAPFGAPAPSLFGAPAPSPFGAPAPSTGLFGAPAPSPFGAPAPSPFGAPAGGSLFGSAAPAPFGAPSGGGLFGQPAPAPFGAPLTGGLFGQPAPAPSGFSFGAPLGGGLFGTPAPAPFGASPGASLFGQPAPVPYGAPAPGFFGAPAPTTFGIPPPQPQPAVIPQNTVIIPPTADESNILGIRALLRTKEELEKSEIWKGVGGVKSKVSTPSSVSEMESLAFLDGSKPSTTTFSPSASLVKVRPRGFPKTGTPAKSKPLLFNMGSGGGDSSSIMPADTNFRSPAMQLVVHPGSLNKPNMRLKPSPTLTESPVLTTPEETPTPLPEASPTMAETESSLPKNQKSPIEKKGITDLLETPTVAQTVSPVIPNAALEEYYQKTINSSADTAPPVSTSRNKSHNAPKLTKAGYETTPPMEELATYADADLAAVPGFSVCRPGYGKVQWLGAVDIRSADLDQIVVIEPKDVSVYSVEELQGTKPEEGTRLNRAADITYYEIFPEDNPDASAEEKQVFLERLQKRTKKMNAEFLSYNKITGEWKIRVRHFSRYNWVDEEDDEDSDTRPSDDHAIPPPTPVQPRSILNRKPSPFVKKGQISFDHGLSPEESEITAAKIRERVTFATKNTIHDYYAPPTNDTLVENFVEEITMDIDENQDVGLGYKFVTPTLSTFKKAGSGFSIVAATRKKYLSSCPSIDAGLRMGKSFRIAWAPDGSLLVPCGRLDAYSVSVSKFRPLYSDDAGTRDDATVNFLEAQLERSEKVLWADCPQFTLPRSILTGGTNESHYSLLKSLGEFSSLPGKSEEGKSAFKLLAYMVGTPVSSKPGINSSDKGYREGSKAALLQWLVDECKASIGEECKKMLSSKSYVEAIFAALSGGDVEQACTMASDVGFHDLASVIATIGASGAEKSDLSRIHFESFAGQRLTPSLDRLIKNIAGDNRFEDNLFRSGSNRLDWRRRLALRALSSSNEGIAEMIEDYLSDVESGTVPYPCPYYSSLSRVQSMQFKVLRAMSTFHPQRLSHIVEPAGYTRAHNDVALSFHLASALVAAIPLPGMLDDYDKICASYASQLIDENFWAWAVVVILCVAPDMGTDLRRRRVEHAKSIVLRHFRKDDHSDTIREFLENEIGIPSSWFEEALSNQSLSVIDYISHTLNFDPPSAIRILETRYLPNVFFMNKGQVDTFMLMIEGMAVARNSVAAGILRFFRLAENLKRVKLRADSDVPTTLEQLLEEHDDLVKIFRSRLACVRNTPMDYRFYVENPMRVSLSSMLYEALTQLSDIRLQIGALAHDSTVQKL